MQTRRMQAVLESTQREGRWLRGYAENLEPRLSQTERECLSSYYHLQVLSFIHSCKETYMSRSFIQSSTNRNTTPTT